MAYGKKKKKVGKASKKTRSYAKSPASPKAKSRKGGAGKRAMKRAGGADKAARGTAGRSDSGRVRRGN